MLYTFFVFNKSLTSNEIKLISVISFYLHFVSEESMYRKFGGVRPNFKIYLKILIKRHSNLKKYETTTSLTYSLHLIIIEFYVYVI